MNQINTRRLVLSAFFMALGLTLPFLIGQIPQIGSMLLPMHIPVFLCGMICGWGYGGAVGFILPLLRSVLFGMPAIFPNAISMAFELAAYGFLSGVLYASCKRQNVGRLYLALVVSMLGGRVVWGCARAIMSGVSQAAFTWQLFLAGGFLNAIPGIILQLVLIPAVLVGLDRSGTLKFKNEA